MVVLGGARGRDLALRPRADRLPRATSPAEGAQPLGYYLRAARMLGTDEQGRRRYTGSWPTASKSCRSEQRLKLDGVRIEYLPADADTVGHLRDRGHRAEGRLRARARTATSSLRSEPPDGGKAVVIAAETLRFFPQHVERRVR